MSDNEANMLPLLPLEIIWGILNYLDDIYLLNLMRVCKEFNTLSSDIRNRRLKLSTSGNRRLINTQNVRTDNIRNFLFKNCKYMHYTMLKLSYYSDIDTKLISYIQREGPSECLFMKVFSTGDEQLINAFCLNIKPSLKKEYMLMRVCSFFGYNKFVLNNITGDECDLEINKILINAVSGLNYDLVRSIMERIQRKEIAITSPRIKWEELISVCLDAWKKEAENHVLGKCELEFKELFCYLFRIKEIMCDERSKKMKKLTRW